MSLKKDLKLFDDFKPSSAYTNIDDAHRKMKKKVVLAANDDQDIVYNHINVKGVASPDGYCNCRFEKAIISTNSQSNSKTETKDKNIKSTCSSIKSGTSNNPINKDISKINNTIDSGEVIKNETIKANQDPPKFTQKPKKKKEKNEVPAINNNQKAGKSKKNTPRKFESNLTAVSECTESND